MVTYQTIDRDVLRPWTAHLVMAPTALCFAAGSAADRAAAGIEGATSGASTLVTPLADRPPL